jgi:hypothetical protein
VLRERDENADVGVLNMRNAGNGIALAIAPAVVGAGDPPRADEEGFRTLEGPEKAADGFRDATALAHRV